MPTYVYIPYLDGTGVGFSRKAFADLTEAESQYLEQSANIGRGSPEALQAQRKLLEAFHASQHKEPV